MYTYLATSLREKANNYKRRQMPEDKKAVVADCSSMSKEYRNPTKRKDFDFFDQYRPFIVVKTSDTNREIKLNPIRPLAAKKYKKELVFALPPLLSK